MTMMLNIPKLPMSVRGYLLISHMIRKNPEKTKEELLRTLEESVTTTMDQVSRVPADDSALLEDFSTDADVLIEARNLLENCFE